MKQVNYIIKGNVTQSHAVAMELAQKLGRTPKVYLTTVKEDKPVDPQKREKRVAAIREKARKRG